MLYIYLLTQDRQDGYDTYDSAVVCAESFEDARNIKVGSIGTYGSWCEPEYVSVTLLGEVTVNKLLSKGVICASFNAG